MAVRTSERVVSAGSRSDPVSEPFQLLWKFEALAASLVGRSAEVGPVGPTARLSVVAPSAAAARATVNRRLTPERVLRSRSAVFEVC